jgi:TPR repeat protein
VLQDHTEAIKWFRLAAEQGDTRAQSNLGTMHGQGKGVRQGYVEVVKWFRLAADHANAQYNLGNMYYEGRGIWHKTMSKQ